MAEHRTKIVYASTLIQMLTLNFILNETPSPEQLVNLYDSVGWGHKDYPQMLVKAIENSSFLVCAHADTELIALGRAISDGVFTVYFPDLLVKPEWQNKGIGGQMMEIMLKHFEGFHNQVLIAEDEAARAFYLKQGFVAETNALSILSPFKEIELQH